MPNPKDPTPTVGNDNYQLLLEKFKEYDSKIEALEKANADIVAMNRELLTTSEPKSQGATTTERRAELEKKLKEGLKNA